MYERIKAIIDRLESGDTKFAYMHWVGKDYSKQDLLDDLNALLMPPETTEEYMERKRQELIDDPKKAMELLVAAGIYNPDGTLTDLYKP